MAQSGPAGAARRLAAALATLIAALALAAAPASAATGEGFLSQFPSPGGCWSELATPGCFDSNKLKHAAGVVVSPDSRTAYVASYESSSVTGYSLTPAGAIKDRIACWSLVLVFGCQKGKGLDGARGLALAPDGKTLYVASASHVNDNGGVASFARDPATGALPSELNCKNVKGTDGCGTDVGLEVAQNVAVSNDGKTVYVSAYAGGPSQGALVAYRVLASGAFGAELSCKTGTIGPTPGCESGGIVLHPSGLAVPPDGRDLFFTTTADGGGVASYKLNPDGSLAFPNSCVSDAASACTVHGDALTSSIAITMSRDNRFVYATSASGGGAVIALTREAATGRLEKEIGCMDATGSGNCRRGHAITNPLGIGIAPDGRTVYAGSTEGVAAFSIDTVDGSFDDEIQCLQAVADANCGHAAGVTHGTGVAVSSNGRALYIAAQMTGGSGALSVFRRELAPVCTPVTRRVATGLAVRLKVSCSDPNGDPITLFFSLPGHGGLTQYNQKAGTVVYRSNKGFIGTDKFTVRASDGRSESTPATFTLLVRKDGPPSSRIAKLPAKQKAKSLKRVTGTATDDAAVRRVEVAIVAPGSKGKPCLLLGKKGTLSSGDCKKRVWLRAKGTLAWRFKLKKSLPKGRYVVYSRATDSAGHVERKFTAKRRNRASFKLT